MLELASFEERHLPLAAELLAARHRADREAEPLLAARYCEPAAAATLVEQAFHAEGASGAVAFRDGRPAGFLLGQAQENAVRGRHAWVHSYGHALAEDELGEVLRDLYAAASEPWVAAGHLLHFADVPTRRGDVLEAWYRLGFGQQQGYGVRPLGHERTPDDRGLDIVKAGPEDVEDLVPLGLVVHDAHGRPPVYDEGPSATEDEIRADWAEEVVDDDIAIFLARRDGRPLGFLGMYAGAGSNTELLVDEGNALLFLAATVEEARGSGVGLALTEHAFAWAAARGLTRTNADWRVTNLSSSRFWPARGYRVAQLRLHRRLADSAPHGLVGDG